MTNPLPNVITISGQIGAGKSTVTKLLSEKLGYKKINAGSIYRSMAAETHHDLVDFLAMQLKDPQFDYELDRRMLFYAKNYTNVILEARLIGHLTLRNNIKAYRIWLYAPLIIRLNRIARREGKTYELVKRESALRDKTGSSLYKKYYGIDLKDLSIYDIKINTANLNPKQVVKIILKQIYGF